MLSRIRRFPTSAAALAATLLACAAAPAHARPAHLRSLQEYYGRFLGAGLATCGTCHQAAAPAKAPASLADFPHNAFGDRLRRVGEQLAAGGKRADIGSRLKAVAGEDADGDGISNETELLAGRRPGDSKDRPTPAELAAARKRMPQLQAFLAAYRWRPFEPVRRPAVPTVANPQFPIRNPIDAFIAAEHAKHGLKPRPEAGKEVLLRRVYLDLTGLAPTPEERRAFLADSSPDAYEKVVDRLLGSAQYGERWGRHWMDVWRYSDWTGYGEQVRDSQPHIWRWRDWIVNSLNRDKGYDRMVQEMLAGDEMAPEDPEALAGTGFLVRQYKLLSREKWMEDTVEHTGLAFLGATIGCARCHDHMYDPISQKEYYRFRAIFEPYQVRTDWVPGQLDTKKDGLPRAYDARPDVTTYLYVRGDERQPLKDDPLAPGVPNVFGGTYRPEPVPLSILAHTPDKQPYVIAMQREQLAARLAEARKAGEACKSPEEEALAKLKLDAAGLAQQAFEAVLRVEQLEDAGKKTTREWHEAAVALVRLQRRGALAEALLQQREAADRLAAPAKQGKGGANAAKALREAAAAAEAAVLKAQTELKQPDGTAYKPRLAVEYPAASTGRRLALARWLTAPDNPLAARVAVNQIWMRHFGQPLVTTVTDFGHNGKPPAMPQILDWMASAFMARADGENESGRDGERPVSGVSPSLHPSVSPSTGGNVQGTISRVSPSLHPSVSPSTGRYGCGWSMKKLHRLIVTSSAYRLASTPDPADLAKDPDNLYCWRMNSKRMDGEIVRDNVLWAAGQLDLTMGGPDIDQNLGLKVKRRTIYFRHAAEKEMVFLNLFDGPSVTECYRRKETVIPQQALALANSEIAAVQSRILAARLAQSAGSDPAAFVLAAYDRVLGRAPRAEEASECARFLAEQAKRYAAKVQPAAQRQPAADGGKPSPDPATRAREDLVLVLFNHNDFITIR